MSRKAASPRARRRPDRRVRRTRDRLGDALVFLMMEKPFDAITVREVLDRAGIGRSTFYAHFRDKNDLFLSDVDEFFEWMAASLARNGDESDRLAPVREFFSHVAHARRFHDALVSAGRIHDVLDLGREHFGRAIAARLRGRERTTRGMSPARRSAVSQALAGAMLSLLAHWLRNGSRESPDEMDDLFHRVAWSGAGAAEPLDGAPRGVQSRPVRQASLPGSHRNER